MTERLYADDAYLKATQARVVAVEGGAVLLDRTVFYPAGGGQPGDSGALTWADGEARVTDTRKGQDLGQVLHLLAEGAPSPPLGAVVTATLDWGRRHTLMRMHTLLHLMCCSVDGYVTGGQIGEQKSRLDFDIPGTAVDKAALTDTLNRLITEDHPTSVSWITDAELAAQPDIIKTLTVKPPTGSGTVRLVTIGDPATPVDRQPCGGTHVARTGEIGPVAVAKIENKGKQNRRISVVFAGAA